MDEKTLQLETYANTVLLLSNVARIEQTVDKQGSTLIAHAKELDELKNQFKQMASIQESHMETITESREILSYVQKIRRTWKRWFLAAVIIPVSVSVLTVLWILDPDAIAVRFLRVLTIALVHPTVSYWTHGAVQMDDTIPTVPYPINNTISRGSKGD